VFNVLAMVAEFESDLIRLRSREGMKIANAKGRLRDRHPKAQDEPGKHLLELHDSVPDHAAQGLAHFSARRSRHPSRRTRLDGGSD
jgi:DNA invertase Pin-like site-specific DNA recombinase